ncbi:dermonecrotic toxin domain-containing protein [Pseudomonas sp.]|jgi:hypothetical protein|uniref:dermonecrotic toxin domain-containing protein n=1 Tax=Pseudomonas sp. TaxID=306 RepID=UPI0037C52F02
MVIKNNASANFLRVIVVSLLLVGYHGYSNAQSVSGSTYVSVPDRVKALESKYNAAWGLEWLSRYGRVMSQMPDPRAMTREVLNNKFGARGAVADFKGVFDSEDLYYVTFNGGLSDSKSFTGWQHRAQDVKSAVKLTDAALADSFQGFEQDSLSALSGVYYSGSGESQYGVANEVKLLPRTVSEFVWQYDIQSRSTEASNRFWAENKSEYSRIYKDALGLEGFNAFKKNQISFEASVLVEAMVNGAFSLGQSYSLDIYGYKSNSILWVESLDRSFALLYIPGADKALVEFTHRDGQSLEQQVRSYIVRHLKEPVERAALARHFSLYDRQDGVSYTGLDNALKGLADGSWAPSYILYNKSLISGDVFSALADATQARLVSDGDVQIKSNGEIARDHAIRTVQAMLTFVPIVNALAPEIMIPLDIAIAATTLGLSLDVITTGDTLDERISGIDDLDIGSLIAGVGHIIPGVIRGAKKLSFHTARLKGVEGLADHSFSFNNRNGIPIDYEGLKVGDKPVAIVHPKTAKQIHIVRLSNEADVVAMSKVGGGHYVEVDFKTGVNKSNKVLYEGVHGGKKVFYSSEPHMCF